MNVEKSNKELLKEYHETQSEKTLEQIMIKNDKLNYYIAKRFLSTGEELEDLASLAKIGMFHAIKTFDISKGFVFTTYATRCMANEILMYIRSLKKLPKCVSLDNVICEDDGNTLTIADIVSTDEDILQDCIEKEDIIELRNVIETLKDKEKTIIKEYYFNNKTQKEISEELNISQSYVARLIDKIILNLKKNLSRRNTEMAFSKEQIQRIREKYDKGLTAGETANFLNIGYSTVRVYYKKWDNEKQQNKKEVKEVKQMENKPIIKEEKKIEEQMNNRVYLRNELNEFVNNSIYQEKTPEPKCNELKVSVSGVGKKEAEILLNFAKIAVSQDDVYDIVIQINKSK